MLLEHRAAIGDAIHAFYAAVDAGKASQTALMFTPDARLTFGPGSPQPGTIEGVQIGAAMEARERQTAAFTRHVVTNLVFEGTGGGTCVSYILTLYRSDDEGRDSKPAFVADVRERWSFQGSGWLIAEREIIPAFFRS